MSPNQTATAMILDTCTDTCISKKRSCAIVKELTSSLNSLLPNTCDFHSLWIQLQHSQKVKNNATGSSSTTAINSTGQSLGISKRSSLISPKQKLSSKERILYTENFIAVQRDIDWLQSKLDPSHVDFMVIGGSGEFGDNDNNDESNSLLALFQQVNQKRSQEQSLKSDVTKAKVQKQSILEMDRTVQQLRDKIQNLVQKIQILKVEGNYHGLNHEEVIRARREAFTRDWNFQQEDLREKSKAFKQRQDRQQDAHVKYMLKNKQQLEQLQSEIKGNKDTYAHASQLLEQELQETRQLREQNLTTLLKLQLDYDNEQKQLELERSGANLTITERIETDPKSKEAALLLSRCLTHLFFKRKSRGPFQTQI